MEASEELEGRTCVVTGANTGVGLETARAFLHRGARVFLACRNRAKAEAAAAELRADTGREAVELVDLDLAERASIEAAAEALRERADRIDILVNNAGLYAGDRRLTAEGFEMSFGVNHLGHFLFTWRLLDRLGEGSRVVVLASEAHRLCRGLDWEDLHWERRRYRAMPAYAASKLANILFARELARRLEGEGVVVHAVHPGIVASRFGQDGDGGWLMDWGYRLGRPFMLTPAQGARTSVHVATSAEAGGTTGLYWRSSRPATPSRAARDDAAARRLWDLSLAAWGLA